MRKLFLLSISAFLCTFINAQDVTVQVDKNSNYGEGIVYYLPQTKLHVVVEVERTTYEPGPYVNYAKLYFGNVDPIVKSSQKWELKSIQVTPVASPDENKKYITNISTKSTAHNLSLTHNGILAAVNSEVFDDVAAQPSVPSFVLIDDEVKFDFKLLSKEAILASSVAKTAELVAAQIYDIREFRTNLLSGENPQLAEDDALDLMLKGLDKAESELMAFFVGKKVTQKVQKVLTYVPQQFGKDILFRFSAIEGVVDVDNLVGSPINITINSVNQSDEMSSNNGKKVAVGLYYNIPRSANVEIADMNEQVYYKNEMLLPQLGMVTSLPASLFYKYVGVIFNPETGGIIRLSNEKIVKSKF